MSWAEKITEAPALSLTEASATISSGAIDGPFVVVDHGRDYGTYGLDPETRDALVSALETAAILSNREFAAKLVESIRQEEAGELIPEQEVARSLGVKLD